MAWCCLGGKPPEMEYESNHGNGMTLYNVEHEGPVAPDDETLDAMFADLVDELDLDQAHRDAMFGLPPEKKWQIYCSKTREMEDPNFVSWPDYYIERIRSMSAAQVFFALNEDEMSARLSLVDSLKTALRTQPMRFVIRFIELDGLTCLLNFLEQMDFSTSQGPVHTSVIGCIKALMNNTQGRAHVLAHPDSINTISQSLSCDNIKTKTAVIEILGAVCLVPGGHKKVLAAMLHYQQYSAERTRFQTILNELDRSTGEYREEVNLKTAIMSFINASLNYGPGQNHLEFRLHLRYEYLMLGIQPIIDKLRLHENAMLDRHLDFFEMVRNEDEKQFAKVFEQVHVDTKSVGSMFDVLKKKISFSAIYPHFSSILQHLLILTYMKTNASNSCSYWQLVDRIIQQVVLQQRDSGIASNPDQAPLEIDVQKLIKQLANESEVKQVQQKMKELYKEREELNSKLAKKERECDIKSQEKEELLATLNKMKARLERETSGHLEARQRLDELSNRVNGLQQQVTIEHAERERLEKCVKTGSYPDDAKVDLIFTTPPTACLAPPPPVMGGPPPPPSPGVPGPPPPPGAPPLTGPGMAVKKKHIPKSGNPLKSFNWSKIPETKLSGTVWTDLDDAKVYGSIDLGDLDQMFSAYQRTSNDDSDDSGYSTLTPCRAKPKELSVIDGRRAQNCTILLSRLKMTNDELSGAIWSMDSGEELPKDMCEQLLKFVPSQEEIQMLNEHEHEINQMARADRFLYDMSRIPHYGPRLDALYFKKRFTERVSECRPKIEAVLEASSQVLASGKLKRILEIVLALGNYMNRGARGNAFGFKLTSLNKIIDTKSSANRNMTLLHFLTDTLQKKFPDLLGIENDLSSVKDAAKVSLPELDKDMAILRAGLANIEKELKYHRSSHQSDYDDLFVPAMSDFITVSQYNFSELDDQMDEMKRTFVRAVKHFGEETSNSQPDEFYGMFDQFLCHFAEAHAENEKFKKMKEEEKRRAEQEAKVKAEKEKQRIKRQKKEDKGEFDDLISALRTGDVFGEDMVKMKRSRQRPPRVKKLELD